MILSGLYYFFSWPLMRALLTSTTIWMLIVAYFGKTYLTYAVVAIIADFVCYYFFVQNIGKDKLVQLVSNDIQDLKKQNSKSKLKVETKKVRFQRPPVGQIIQFDNGDPVNMLKIPDVTPLQLPHSQQKVQPVQPVNQTQFQSSLGSELDTITESSEEDEQSTGTHSIDIETETNNTNTHSNFGASSKIDIEL